MAVSLLTCLCACDSCCAVYIRGDGCWNRPSGRHPRKSLGSSDCSVWNVCCGRGATAVEEAAAVEKDAVEVAAAEESAAVEEDAIVEEAAAVEVARTHFGRHAIKSHGYLGGRKLSTAPPTDPEGTVGGTTAVKLYSILSGSLCDS